MRSTLTPWFFSIFLLLASVVSGQTSLSGNIGGLTLEKSGNPFIISETVTVPAGKKVTVQHGCVLLFKPFSGLQIEGNLTVEGTAEEPVIFTSFNDTAYNDLSGVSPDPFDWNGILISSKARTVDLSYFTLTYSVYGIKSQTYNLQIRQGRFADNGQFNFTISEEIQPVIDAVPFNYSREADTLHTIDSVHTPRHWNVLLGISTEVIGIAGLSALSYALYRMNGYSERYDNSLNTPEADHNAFRYDTWRKYAIISGSTGGLFTLTGTAVLLFNHLRQNRVSIPPVSLHPFVGNETGFTVVMEF